MPNNKKSKCQQLFIVGCLSILCIVLQTAHVVLCNENDSSTTTTTTTSTVPTHISSTLNNVPSSTIIASTVITTTDAAVTVESMTQNTGNATKDENNEGEVSDKTTTEVINVTSTTAEPIPTSLPLVHVMNVSNITETTTTTTTTDEVSSNEIRDNEVLDRVDPKVPSEILSNEYHNQKTMSPKKPINIDDFYPSKMEDFKMVIQQSNEKMLREKEILRNNDDDVGEEMNNPLLKPMDLLPIISDKKDLLLEDRNGNGSDIATTNIEIELIEPDVTKVEGERESIDITEKLQENDEVIKKIEESFKIDDMDLRPDIVFDVIPSKSSTVPTTIETKVMSTTTTTTTHAPTRSHHIPQESGFIPRRVKKNDPKIEGKISVLNRATLKRIDFANTKFKSHPNNNNGLHLNEQQSTNNNNNNNNNKYKSSTIGASSAEFSTTKFYNSKETDINKSNDSNNNNNNQDTVVQTTVMPPSSQILEKAAAPVATTTTTTTTNGININNNDNNKKSTTIANVQTDDDTSSSPISSTTASLNINNTNKKSNNKNVVDMSITANVYPADDIETLHPTIKIPSFHPLIRPRIQVSRLQEKINQLDCDLQSFPPQPPQNAASGLPGAAEEYIKIWRGNETHELSLPIVKLEDCSPSGLDCSPTTISWESTADIQSGDLLLVEIDDSQLISTQNNNNDNQDGKSSSGNLHHTPAASVYQVTRPGHEHCDITEGELLDITPLVVDGKKLVTLYDKDLTEGVNFLIVVSELWGQQCVRLKVTVKSDNCGENADCSGKGICYSNKSMEGYECQCCSGFSGSHCEEIDACTPSPCTNNGICVDLSQGHEGNSYQCLCPYGYTGKNCQFETDPCNPSQCMNGGTCVGNSTHFRCDCVPGFTGPLCQHNLNECESSPCVHGICVDQEDGFRCFCQPGFAGELCNYEFNECESNPCLNGGQCIDHISGFSCKCTAGYTGKRCHVKVDFCANDPCPDGHRCIDHGDDFSCECPGGRNGPDCNQVPRTLCNVNPCANGGTCWTTEESFYCACRPGFTGKMCEDTFVIESVVNTNELLSDLTPNAHIGLESPDFNEDPFEVHSVYVAIGTLTAAICIVAVVVTACHCKVHQTYRHFSPQHLIPVFMRRSGSTNISAGTDRHWLSGKGVQNDPENSYCTNNLHYHGGSTFASDRISRPLPPINLDSEMYYTVDFSDSQNSPLIQ